jgi:cellulose synthase/poly-beta-1,6-N-acetylglucosamine synthase-like glycosyltransferase
MKVGVSIIIPVRNEEKHIRETIDRLLDQDFLGSYEIVIIDGHSKDNTSKIVREMQKKNKNILLFENPSGNTAIGRNIGVEKSHGKYVMNFSGHALAEKNLLKTLVKKLDKAKSDIAAVGCANVAPDDNSLVAKSVGVVYQSIFGGVKSVDQNAIFTKDTAVPSIAFTLYRREILEKVGMFDQKFWCGQDFELNYRINEKGYKIIFTPETRVLRYNRDSVKKFANQMYRYGIARNFIMKKHPNSFKIQYTIPSLLVLYAVLGLILSFASRYILIPFVVSWAVYVVLGWASSLLVTRNPILILISPAYYLIEHVMYGCGFIRGFFLQKF